ncbi:MAG: PorV/PorQ family protein [bacterium]|nr:PorV/PorQ family protein [bacterium]
MCIVIKIVLILFIILGYATESFSLPIDLQLGARPQGMGGAFVAMVDDVNAVYWNPAGLTQLRTFEAAFMHVSPFSIGEASIDFSSLAVPMSQTGALGISWIHQRAELEEGRGATYKKSDMSENTFVLSLARRLTSDMSLGVNVKRLRLDSEIGGGGGFGYDLGLLYRGHNIAFEKLPFQTFSLGVMFRNLFTDLKDESVPATSRMGVATKVYNGRVALAVDMEKKKEVNKEENSYQFHFGGEYAITRNVLFRLGSDDGDLTYGAGFLLLNWELDYAFYRIKEYDLDYSHRMSATLKF